MRLLVTRPEPDATRTAETLRARGHAVLVAPLFSMQSIEAQFAGSYDGVLMTSANAARALAAHPHAGELTPLTCFAVGSRTAEAARAAGFADTVSADGARDELVQLVAGRFGASARLLYLAGEDRAGDLAGDLGKHRIAVETVVIYRARPAERLSPELAQALKQSELDGVLHYSRRSVTRFLALAGKAGAADALTKLAHYCLSAEVAAPLRKTGAGRVIVAPQRQEASLLELIQE